jgi:putative transposase
MIAHQEHWNLPAPPGFQGLRGDLPLEVYEQALPHWRQDGATYFVTFRLNDSLPQEKLHELRAFKSEFANRRANQRRPNSKVTSRGEMAREIMRRVEGWLDEGSGDCCLRPASVASIVLEAMLSTDGSRCELDCCVVMPNHVHAVVRPLHPREDPLENIIRTWKGTSARLINELLGRSGVLWQRESFDRIVRDEEHLWRVLQYIGDNPSKASLTAAEALLWIRPEWVKLGWCFECSVGLGQ